MNESLSIVYLCIDGHRRAPLPTPEVSDPHGRSCLCWKICLYFSDSDSVHVEHQFPFDDVGVCADAFCVFDDGLAGGEVAVDEVGYVFAGAFYADLFGGGGGHLRQTGCACGGWRRGKLGVLGGDEEEGDLLAEVGDEAGSLSDFELGGSAVFAAGGVASCGAGAVFVFSLPSAGKWIGGFTH